VRASSSNKTQNNNKIGGGKVEKNAIRGGSRGEWDWKRDGGIGISGGVETS